MTNKPVDDDVAPIVRRDDDAALFAQHMQGVKPLSQPVRQPPPPPKAKSQHPAAQFRRSEAEALRSSLAEGFDPDRLLDTDDGLSFRQSGISEQMLRNMRRGRWAVAAELDLHGLRSDEAQQAVNQFIQHCHQSGKRLIRIIHGKGLGSAGREPVLKQKVKRWLQHCRPVLAFCQAPAHSGGSGALLVLLSGRHVDG